MALKKAERSDRWLARIRETGGASSVRVELGAPAPLVGAELVDGCERSASPAELERGRLILHLPRFAPRTVLLKPSAPPRRLPPLPQSPVALDFDTPATSFHGRRGVDFDGAGHSIPGELFPPGLRVGGLRFVLGPNEPGVANSLSCRGQKIELPAGDFDRLALVAASTSRTGSDLRTSGAAGLPRIPYYSGFVGQWKRFSGRIGFLLRRWRPGFIERTRVAWVATHRHDRGVRNEVYTYCYLFVFEIPIARGSRALELPGAPEAKIFAATAFEGDAWDLEPGAVFYD